MLDFPLRLLAAYFISYIAPAVSNTYLMVYLAETGMSASQIGLIISISTVVLLIGQMLWGVASDRAGSRNHILLILFAGSTVMAVLCYFASGFWALLIVVSLLMLFLSTSSPIQDTISMEILDGSKWDFGSVRIGGIFGYGAAVLLSGWLLQNRYEHIFWIIALFQMMSFVIYLRLPRVNGGHRSALKPSYAEILRNKPLMMIAIFNLAFALGNTLYMNFYPVFLSSIGGDSSFIGIVGFVCTLSEVPMILIIGRLINRFGTARVMIIAGMIATVRWFLLFAVTTPALIVVINLLHGMSYTSFTYGVITYINKQVPREARATSQAFNVVACSVVSRVIFGYLGGLIADSFGMQYLMLLSGAVIMIATLVFGVWCRCYKRTAGVASI